LEEHLLVERCRKRRIVGEELVELRVCFPTRHYREQRPAVWSNMIPICWTIAVLSVGTVSWSRIPHKRSGNHLLGFQFAVRCTAVEELWDSAGVKSRKAE